MRVKAFLCAESVILDVATNRVSCINILDGLASPQFPLLMPQLAAVGMFERDAGDADEHNCELTIHLNDVELARGPILVSFQDANLTRAMVSMNGLVFPQPGQLKMALVENDAEIATWVVNITQLEQILA